MTSIFLKSIIAVSVPILVLFSGGKIMSQVSGRGPLIDQLEQSGHMVPKSLNQRWLGYETEEAHEYWCRLQAAGRITERTFLQLDLVFPFFYLAALAASLFWVRTVGGRWFHPAWIAVPLAIVLFADWIENLIQLEQLSHYDDTKSQEGIWVMGASCATIVKLWLIAGALLALIGLVSIVITDSIDRRRRARQ